MKKIASIILTVMMAVTLAACTNSGQKNESATDSSTMTADSTAVTSRNEAGTSTSVGEESPQPSTTEEKTVEQLQKEAEEVEEPTVIDAKDFKVEDYQGFQQGQSNTKNLTFPFKVEETGLTIKSLGQYTGPFVEDGSDLATANVTSIIVTNKSKKTIQYAKITFSVNKKETAEFVITTLTPGATALIEEASAKEYSQDDKYKYDTVLNAQRIDTSMMEDKISVKQAEGSLTIENLSSEDLGTVYVYYKNISEGIFLGGITYRTKFENVKGKAILTEKTSHFINGGSQIIMVENIPG